MSRTEEDNIKLIFKLQAEANKSLIINKIKDVFGKTNQNVTDMIKRLNNQKLVKFIHSFRFH